jgi:hypothetical protein
MAHACYFHGPHCTHAHGPKGVLQTQQMNFCTLWLEGGCLSAIMAEPFWNDSRHTHSCTHAPLAVSASCSIQSLPNQRSLRQCRCVAVAVLSSSLTQGLQQISGQGRPFGEVRGSQCQSGGCWWHSNLHVKLQMCRQCPIPDAGSLPLFSNDNNASVCVQTVGFAALCKSCLPSHMMTNW